MAKFNQKAESQEEFLRAYSAFGTIRAAAKAADIDRSTVSVWRKSESFREKFDSAKDDFREQLEEIAFQRLKEQGPKDNPVLLITLLNAHIPERYRPKETPPNEEGKEFMRDMRRHFARLKSEDEDEQIINPTVDDEIKRILDRKRGRPEDRPNNES